MSNNQISKDVQIDDIISKLLAARSYIYLYIKL